MEPNKGEIVMYQPDETIRLEVRMDEETVWLTQQQMAELFQKDQSVVARHINNAFKEGELDENSNMHFLHNTRYKYRPTKVYSLDVIISVGYRVKSKRGTAFRQWANKVLKDYLLRGYAINKRIAQIEQRTDTRFESHAARISALEDKVDFFVRSSLPPVEGIFYDGQIFDAYAQIINLIKQAKRSIILIDNYINVDTLTMLSKRDANVSATIYTRQLSNQQQLDITRHNQQYPPITVNLCQRRSALPLATNGTQES